MALSAKEGLIHLYRVCKEVFLKSSLVLYQVVTLLSHSPECQPYLNKIHLYEIENIILCKRYGRCIKERISFFYQKPLNWLDRIFPHESGVISFC